MSFRERVAILLRGEYNSVRFRFLYLPIEWLTYLFLYRLRGKSWIEFYGWRMDEQIRRKGHVPPKQRYLDLAEIHAAFLRRHGLRTTDRVLDYGCGLMRTGLKLSATLTEGLYVGVDISAERIAQGRDLMRAAGVPEERYETHVVSDCRLEVLRGRQFDVVWANSVLTHMPAEDIQVMFRSIQNLLAPDGRYFFTFAEAGERKRKAIKDFWYPREEIERFSREAGFQIKFHEDWENSDVMCCATKLPGATAGAVAQ
jgi:SAM-dependent methyltransferase